MRKFTILLSLPLFILITAAITRKETVLPSDVEAAYQQITRKMDFNRDIKPILSDKCFACHGPDKAKQKAGLRLDDPKSAFGPLPESPGKVAIRPGDLDRSELIARIMSTDPEMMMPTPASHLSLTTQEKAMLARWIDQGAEYQPHWAFVKPVKLTPPALSGEYKADHPVDRFVRAKLQEMNLKPSREASRELLLRRLSLDITGLPPTLEEIDSFLADTSANAWEKQVDRLLQSPHYGERMAADWLDLARFADSHGYSVDRLRDMSPYRDWVINAYNRNMPYDRFIHEQLAGDLMPQPTRDMLIATAFNRLHQQNMEGGIVEEEFQAEYVIDRTNTFGEAFMATSLSCARCHDHKYDPISQKNYFELFSFFNNVLEAGQISFNDDLPTPNLMLPTAAEAQTMAQLNAWIGALEQKLEENFEKPSAAADAWIAGEYYKPLAAMVIPQYGLQGRYLLDGNLAQAADTSRKGVMKRDAGEAGDKPVFVPGKNGQALSLDGDGYLDLKPVGVFRKSEPFTVGMWIWVPRAFNEGVIFHKSEAERLYNFKGFNVSVKDNRFALTMAHTAPSNAIIKVSEVAVPREKWIQLTLTYDGSSRAAGLKLYQDGSLLPMEVVIDKLYKDIIFYRKEEPALQVGAWWRGTGFKGGKVDEIVVYNRELLPFETGVLAGKTSWQTLASRSASQLSAEERQTLKTYYLRTSDTLVRQQMDQLKQWRTQLADTTRHIRQIMVMEEMPKPRKSYLLVRGEYQSPGEQVFPNTPQAILPFKGSWPPNRYGLAQWLTHPDHPLTARVAVNRLWQQFFGTGLVKTSEDFGNQGSLPSHPELLDWLAVTFRESGWDIKAMIRLMVTSSTYRQDAFTSPSLRETDPENRWLARGPSIRLTAEMLRDNVLAASGLLNRKMGGESIRTYQPAGLWEINSMSYRADSTDNMYRRSVYMLVKRSVPHPTLGTFDASERSSCLSRRQKTNTPLQALVMLNDPTYVEAARALGASVVREKDTDTMIRVMYRKLTGKSPTVQEMDVLLSLHRTELEKFNQHPDKMKGWLSTGIYPQPSGVPASLLAANAVVASVIMNADATITKR